MRIDLEKIFGKQDNGSDTTVDPKSVLVLEVKLRLKQYFPN